MNNDKKEDMSEDKNSILNNDNEIQPAEDNTLSDSSIENKNDDDEKTTNQNSNKGEDDTLLEEIQSLKEEKIRLLAEMENLRKRFEREKLDLTKFSNTGLVRDFLSPGDNLDRALKAIPNEENISVSIKNLIEGIKMVHREFNTILEKNGVKKIEAINKKFDHNYHQAMMEIEDENVEEGIVLTEIQSGYTMHERLIRPAMVGVSKKPVSKMTEPKKKGRGKNKENK